MISPAFVDAHFSALRRAEMRMRARLSASVSEPGQDDAFTLQFASHHASPKPDATMAPAILRAGLFTRPRHGRRALATARAP